MHRKRAPSGDVAHLTPCSPGMWSDEGNGFSVVTMPEPVIAKTLAHHPTRIRHGQALQMPLTRRFRWSGAISCWWAILGLNFESRATTTPPLTSTFAVNSQIRGHIGK